jgi:cation diffusion facilitator family transporter
MSNEHKNEVLKENDREKVIVRTSIVGIVTNIILVIFKMLVGFFTNSIAVILDAVNNLSDVVSSVITIIGTRLAGKDPDKKHPLGHGRTEYLTAMIVSALVLYAGLLSLRESIKKIINPEPAEYNLVSLVIIFVAVIVKVVLGTYVKKKGESVNSNSLIASGEDARFDGIISFSVFATALIYIFTNVSLEAYVGVIISIFIIRSGFTLMKESLDDIVGHRPDSDVTKNIKKLIAEEKDVRGAYDVIIYDFGPDKLYASCHIEVPDTMNIAELDRLTRKIEKKVLKEMGVVLTAIGVYSYNTNHDEAALMRDNIIKHIVAREHVIQVHGFYVDTVEKEIRFDAVLTFDTDHKKEIEEIKNEVLKMYEGYTVNVVADIDLSD